MTFGSAMQNMNLGETTLGFDYRSGEGGKSLGLSSTFTPPTLMESIRLGAMGINPAAPSAALGLHMGASAGILQLTAHQGKMNAANVFKAIRGVRSAVAVGTPSTTSGRISFSDAIIQSFKEAHGIDEEANAKATGEDEGKSTAATGGPKGQLPDPDKDGKETKVEQGKSQAPEVTEANSIYEQLDDKGTSVKSRTFYDENGRQFARQDYGHAHKIDGNDVIPHEHVRYFDAQGLPITGKVVRHVPSGYSNVPSL